MIPLYSEYIFNFIHHRTKDSKDYHIVYFLPLYVSVGCCCYSFVCSGLNACKRVRSIYGLKKYLLTYFKCTGNLKMSLDLEQVCLFLIFILIRKNIKLHNVV